MKSEDKIAELTCNIDDMTPEHLAICIQQLFDFGALDVIAVPIIMKKGRLGYQIQVLSKVDDATKMAKQLLTLSTTAGVRIEEKNRIVMDITYDKIDTPFGTFTVKKMKLDDIEKIKLEADEIKVACLQYNCSFLELQNKIIRIFENKCT